MLQLKMSSFETETIVKGCELGEGPHWDDRTQALYFSDVPGKFLHRYIPSTKTHDVSKTDTWISIIIPIEGMENKFLISNGLNLSIMSWDAHGSPTIIEKLATVEEDKPDNNFNDGKVDDTGRVWIGTMGPILSDGKIPQGKASLYSFGDKSQPGIRHHVLHIDPKSPGGGKLLSTVPIPADQVTSVAFGGPNLTDLYVTSSSKGLSEEKMAARPLSGSTFCIKGLGVKGLPANSFKWHS
ncbi:hypothetical protein J437_LFUL001189 [Ladona fulva]|uniref:Regucalcin n=1 Tax=Ladona fulva TaxID=123851 RepID=A0A8K0JV98_LADFU|nr:hypothetical protein J437_LFUL001189 [Ladona fulva]